MKDRSLRAVVIVSSLNFALKSEEEKDAIVSSYQQFLNGLSFPIQILATSRKIDLTSYLKTVEATARNQSNPFIKDQTEEYYTFLQDLLDYSNIMEKRFYVVIPFYPSGVDISALPNPFAKQDEPVLPFEEQKKNLMQRVEVIINGLSSVGLRCVALGTEDLLELYFSIYNPDVSQNQKVGNAETVDLPIAAPAPEQPGGTNEPMV